MELKDKYFKLLDNGFVALKDVMGDDFSIVQAARVSYGKGTKAISDDRTLIRYLVRQKHTTPLEMVVFKFHISMPIHCHRQFIRHRMSTTNEYSARYSEVPEIIYDDYTLNLQSKNNKQGRSENVLDETNEYEMKSSIRDNEESAFRIYRELVDKGVAREIARMHLPLNTYTCFYWKIDLHNLFHFLKLRCDSHAQEEIRTYANCLAGIIKEVCPIAFEAWYDYSFTASNWTRLDKEFNNWLQSNDSIFTENEEVVQQKIKEIGMSKREFDEFWQKLKVPEYKDFNLSKFEIIETPQDKQDV